MKKLVALFIIFVALISISLYFLKNREFSKEQGVSPQKTYHDAKGTAELEVLFRKDKRGDFYIDLLQNSANNYWSLINDECEIKVSKTGNTYDVSIEHDFGNGSKREIKTQIIANPGEQIILGRSNGSSLFLKVPNVESL